LGGSPEKRTRKAGYPCRIRDFVPPGYFGRFIAFSPEGRYGSWLRKLPAVIKINNTLFVHGGLTKEYAGLGLEEINLRVKESFVRYDRCADVMEPHVGGAANFEQIYRTARAITKGTYKGQISKGMVTSVRELIDLLDSPLLSSEGPLWYRGSSLENEQIERRSELIPALDTLGADSVVIGHTPTASGRISSRFNGRVLRTDVGMTFGRDPFCLVLEGDKAEALNPAKGTFELPVVENPQGQAWSRIAEQLSDDQMEDFLAAAEIKSIKPIEIKGRVFDVLELERKGLRLRAVFGAADEKPPTGKTEKDIRLRRAVHELAAYRLGRRLRLRFVPVTVARTIEGKRGVLGVWTEAVIDLPWIREQKMLDLIAQKLKEEVLEAWVFSALIDVEPRLEEAVMLIPGVPDRPFRQQPVVL
jgi:hypothetical protein